MADLSAGRASMPSRIAALVPERDALLAAMPAYLPSSGALATKLVSLFPRNSDRPTHQAVIVVFDASNGSPMALMDGEAITAARTAAGSALATDLLARRDANVLAVIGTGVQARAHLRAMPRVREFREVRVAGHHATKAHELANEATEWLGKKVRAVETYADAIRDADVVSAATHSPEPVVRREWLSEGTHVTSVGYNTAGRGGRRDGAGRGPKERCRPRDRDLGDGDPGVAAADAAAGVEENGGDPLVPHLCLNAIGRGLARVERGDHLVVDAEDDPRDGVRFALDELGVTLLARREGDELSSLDNFVVTIEQAD